MSEPDALANWRCDFPGAPPAGWLLREAFPERWLRTHSLPESKRYAGSEAEMSEVLRRYNAVASEVLSGSECALFVGEFGDQPGGAWAVPMHEADETPYWLNLSAELTVWVPGAFNDLLRAVANDESGPVLFYAIGEGQAFSPYDGGADIFFATESERDQRIERYRSWLSALPSGL